VIKFIKILDLYRICYLVPKRFSNVMSTKTRLIKFLFILFLSVGCTKFPHTNQRYFTCPSKKENELLSTDRQAIIRKLLTRAVVVEKDIPDYALIKDKSHIYILETGHSYLMGNTETFIVKEDEIPTRIKDVEFCLKSEAELQSIADNTYPFLYLTLVEFTLAGDSATIGLNNGWQGQKNSKTVFLSGGGYVWKLKRINGNWIFVDSVYNVQS
jgi:hypothetical protein